MDYKKMAQEIIIGIGGRENISSAAHCATRLRLVLNDETNVNKESIKRSFFYCRSVSDNSGTRNCK